MHLEIPWVNGVVVGNEEVKEFPLETPASGHLGERRAGRGESQPSLPSVVHVSWLPSIVCDVVLTKEGGGDLESTDGVTKRKLDVEDAA